MIHKLLHPHHTFTVFKYGVYGALALNVWLFFREDWQAAVVMLDTAAPWARLIEVFAQTIDTFAWVVLLALFELETSVLPDATLRHPRVKWTLHGVRALCALVILNSLAGYAGKYLGYLEAERLTLEVCSLAGDGWFRLDALDEFSPLDAGNCATLAGEEVFRLHGGQVVSSLAVLAEARWFALLDAVNAAAWILVVLVLEVDVRLQLRGVLRGTLWWTSGACKLLLYAVLLLAVVLWAWDGDLLDFWDALLWLLAFVFIEMNVFQWRRESVSAV